MTRAPASRAPRDDREGPVAPRGRGRAAPFTVFVVPITTADGRSVQPDGEVCYEGSGEVDVLGSTDHRAFTTVQRPHLVKGRRADPDRADEVLLS